MKRVRRLSNAELAFLEDTIAGAVGIIQEVKAMVYWIDDADQLEMLLRILQGAQRVRRGAIEWMARRRGEVGVE